MKTKSLLWVGIFALISLSQCKTYTPDAHLKLFPFAQNNQYGFMDSTGKEVITPQFDFVEEFSEGYAAVLKGDKWGFIRQDGKIAIEPKFAEISSFSEGYATFAETVNGKLGFIDTQGKVIIPPTYDFVKPFQEGLACVNDGDNWKYIDTKGEAVFQNTFSYAEGFKNGKALVQNLDGEYLFISKKGEPFIQDTFYQAHTFSDGFSLIAEGIPASESQAASNIFYFIDEKGKKQITNLPYKYVTPFSEGVASVAVQPSKNPDSLLLGTINTQGKEVIKPSIWSTNGIVFVHYQEGFSPIWKNGFWGYMDKNGKEIIKPQFDEAGNFKNGLALVKKDDKIYYIDANGKAIGKSWQYNNESTFVLNFQR